jgi:hypothetical protein
VSDPRFDPRFQRGYDGPPPEAPVRPVAHAPGLPAAARIPDPQLAESRPEPEPLLASSSPVQPGFDDSDIWTPAARNPYQLALLLAGLAMLLGAGILIWFSVRIIPESTVPYDVGQQTISTIQYLIPPALVVGGLTSIIVWLVLGALASRDGAGS